MFRTNMYFCSEYHISQVKPLNNQFITLQAIAITLVVFGHKGGCGISFFKDWFPIYSYHMPLFIFISGYFFSIESINCIAHFIIRKIKRLLIPYFGWNLFYGILCTILQTENIITFGEKLSIESFFLAPWINGGQFKFNLATWFVLSLFLTQVFYIFLRKITPKNITTEYILLILLTTISIISIYISNNFLSDNLKPWLRMGFFLPFFHIGHCYKTMWEKHDTIKSLPYFAILLVIQYLILTNFDKLPFVVMHLNFQNHLFLPLITSITGILFWLRIAKILSQAIGNNKTIIFMGKNTWDIMTHHITVFFLINSIFFIFHAPEFNYQQYASDIWYSYIPSDHHFILVYCIAGIILPLFLRYGINKLTPPISSWKKNYQKKIKLYFSK